MTGKADASGASSSQQPDIAVGLVEGTPVYSQAPPPVGSSTAGFYPPPPTAPVFDYPATSSDNKQKHQPAAPAQYPQEPYPYTSQPTYLYPPTAGLAAPVAIAAPPPVTVTSYTWEDNACCGCEVQVCLHIFGWVLCLFGFGPLLWFVGACLPCCGSRLHQGQHRCGWVANLVMTIISILSLCFVIFAIALTASSLDDDDVYGRGMSHHGGRY